jgi:hypothetical protein
MRIVVIGDTGPKSVEIPRQGGFRRMAQPLKGTSPIVFRQPKEGSMKRILCSLLVATLPPGSALAEAPQSKDAKVTLV